MRGDYKINQEWLSQLRFYDYYPVGHIEFKPWGSWEIIRQNPISIEDPSTLPSTLPWQVKILSFRPEAKMSLQRHEYRSERWTVLSGAGLAMVNDELNFLVPGSVVRIPVGATHRIVNTHPKNDLIILEAQHGYHILESDLERLEDAYGRELGKVDPANG